MKQSARKEIAKHTLQIIQDGFYTNPEGERIDTKKLMWGAIGGTVLFSPDELTELLQTLGYNGQFKTTFEVTNETTLDAVRRMASERESHVLCLNFASAKNPGGGFLGGAVAQEECIVRATGLYPCLLKAKPYYDYHRNQSTCLYSDHMIYSPQVPIFKNEEGMPLIKPVLTSIITAPAVNAGVVLRHEPDNTHKIIPVMRTRIEKLLALCVHKQRDTLVLGTWGCGVFRNKPEDISSLFHAALTGKFAGCFQKVVFAVFTKQEAMIAPFQKYFAS